MPNLESKYHKENTLQVDENSPNLSEQHALLMIALMAGNTLDIYVSRYVGADTQNIKIPSFHKRYTTSPIGDLF